jgi:hypothetical protein
MKSRLLFGPTQHMFHQALWDPVAYPGILFRGGSTNSVEDRGQSEWGSGRGSPQSGVPLNLQMSETPILIRLLWMYFPQNWEFGSALSKLWNFGVEFELPKPRSLVLH